MTNTKTRVQVNVLMTKEGRKLLEELVAAKQKDAEFQVSLGAYVEWLVRREARRAGLLKPQKK